MLPPVTFDPTLTIVPQKSYARFLADSAAKVAVPGATATDKFTLTGHGFINGQVVLATVLTGLSGLDDGFYYVISVDGTSFELAATSDGEAVALTSDGTATITPVVDLVGKLANYDQSIETIKRKVPNASGVMRTDREVIVGQEESFKFEIEEIKWLNNVFGGRLSGLKQGRAQMIITDPDDAADTAAIVTNLFTCAAKLDGGINFQNGQVAKATVMFEAYEEVTVDFDASTV